MISSSAHLVELRQRLLVSFGSIFFFSVLSYFFAEHIARFFMTPLFASQTEVFKLVYTNLTEAFITYLKLSLLIGIIFSIPVLIYELWMFIAPGLHSDEKKTVLSVVFWATLLFSAGACFAFFIADLPADIQLAHIRKVVTVLQRDRDLRTASRHFNIFSSYAYR